MMRLLIAYLLGRERGRSQLDGTHRHTIRAAVLGVLAIGAAMLFVTLVPSTGHSSAPSSVTTTAPATTTSPVDSVGPAR